MLTLTDFKKVEEGLHGYLSTYPESQLKETQKAAESADQEELANYTLLLGDAFSRGVTDEALYEFAMGLVLNWEKTTFHAKFAVGLLIKKTRDDTALWDLLCRQ